eukprot:403346411
MDISEQTAERYFQTLKKQGLVDQYFVNQEDEQKQIANNAEVLLNEEQEQLIGQNQKNQFDNPNSNVGKSTQVKQVCKTFPRVDYDRVNQIDKTQTWDIGSSIVEDFYLPELRQEEQKSLQVKVVKYEDLIKDLKEQNTSYNKNLKRGKSSNQTPIQMFYKTTSQNNTKKSRLLDFSKLVNRETAIQVQTKMIGGQSRNPQTIQSLTHEYDLSSSPCVGRYNINYDQVAYQSSPMSMNKVSLNQYIQTGKVTFINRKSKEKSNAEKIIQLRDQSLTSCGRFNNHSEQAQLKTQNILMRKNTASQISTSMRNKSFGQNTNLNILQNIKELSQAYIQRQQSCNSKQNNYMNQAFDNQDTLSQISSSYGQQSQISSTYNNKSRVQQTNNPHKYTLNNDYQNAIKKKSLIQLINAKEINFKQKSFNNSLQKQNITERITQNQDKHYVTSKNI